MPTTLNEILNSHTTGRAILMGVLNVTPDSFSDGGEFLAPDAAIAQARQMADDGADLIDIGAESTKPGSDRISADEQIARLRQILPPVVDTRLLVSIDTTRPAVAQFALDAGAAIINDVSAGRDDPDILALVARRKAPVILMHMLGAPKSMQVDPHYDDVVVQVRDFLAKRVAAAVTAGVPREHIIIDPGIGFGKLLEHNLAILAGVGELAKLGRPVMIGPSRKRFIGELTAQQTPAKRVGGTIAACLAAWRRGASIFRVHDVGAVRQALTVAGAIEKNNSRENSHC